MRLEEMTRAFEQYKELVKKTFLDDRVGRDPWAKKPEEAKTNGVNGVNGEEKDREWEMDYYFGSYAETEIHESMLKVGICSGVGNMLPFLIDRFARFRMQSEPRVTGTSFTTTKTISRGRLFWMLGAEPVFCQCLLRGRVRLKVHSSCGSSFHCFGGSCSPAVYAVDNSTIINKARKIVAENGFENIIT